MKRLLLTWCLLLPARLAFASSFKELLEYHPLLTRSLILLLGMGFIATLSNILHRHEIQMGKLPGEVGFSFVFAFCTSLSLIGYYLLQIIILFFD
ncbi:MAG: hypothetical protein AAFR61_15090 [Bacteroidota bacterium]